MPRSAIHRLRDEQGSFLVEILVAATLVLIIGMGVVLALQGAEAVSAQTRAKAVAANLADQEVDRLRSLRLVDLQTYLPDGAGRAERTLSVDGDTFTLRTEANWVSATDGSTSCGEAGTTVDLLKLKVTVDPRRQTTADYVLESTLTPSARAAAGQGSAKLEVKDAEDRGVGGLAVTLSGPQVQSAVTDAEGCVQFAYLPAGAYTVAFGRTGWVDPKGRSAVSEPLTLNAEETATASYRYAPAQEASLSFWSQRIAAPLGATPVVADPLPVQTSFDVAFLSHPENDASRLLTLPARTGPPSGQRVGSLFPFTSPYAVWPGRCTPPAPPAGAGAFRAGAQALPTSPLGVRVPALDVQLRWPTTVADVQDAQVVVTTDCGERIGPRAVRLLDGRVTDPGFPYGTKLTVCAQARLRSGATVSRTLTGQRNDRLDGTGVVVDLSRQTIAGACT